MDASMDARLSLTTDTKAEVHKSPVCYMPSIVVTGVNLGQALVDYVADA